MSCLKSLIMQALGMGDLEGSICGRGQERAFGRLVGGGGGARL